MKGAAIWVGAMAQGGGREEGGLRAGTRWDDCRRMESRAASRPGTAATRRCEAMVGQGIAAVATTATTTAANAAT